jgi:hypothetical protein
MLGCPAQPWPTHGPACILADVGEGAGALHCGPGLRCLTWSRPLGLAGGWELGPRRAHSRLGGGRLTVVHSDSHGEPKATIRPGDHGSVTGCPWQRARAADQRTHAAYSVQISQRRAVGMRCAAGQLTGRRADCAADWAHIWSTRSASMVDLGQDRGGAQSQQVPHSQRSRKDRPSRGRRSADRTVATTGRPVRHSRPPRRAPAASCGVGDAKPERLRGGQGRPELVRDAPSQIAGAVRHRTA